MRTYQFALPLLALALAGVFVKETAAWIIPPALCPPNQEPGCYPCKMPYCTDIADPPDFVCSGCIDGGCICKPGYYWKDDKCVPASECDVKCPENMEYKECAKKPIACNQPIPKPEIQDECQPRCVCKPGYILAGEWSNKCIPNTECKSPVH